MASANMFTLTCKPLVGTVVEIEAHQGMTVAEIVQILAEKLEKNTQQIRVMYRAKFLKNPDQTLVDYKITKDTKLKVIVRMNTMVIPEKNHVSTAGGSCRSVCLSRDDKITAAATYNGQLHIIDTKSGEILFENRDAHVGAIRRMHFNRKGNMLVTAGEDRKAKIWRFNGESCEEFKCFEIRDPAEGSAAIWAAWFSKCEKYIVCSADGYNRVKVFEIETGELYREFTHAVHSAKCCQMTGDSTKVISCARGQLRIWDLETTDLLHDIQAHPQQVWNIYISADDQYVFSLGINKALKKHNINTGELEKEWALGGYDFQLIKDGQFAAFNSGGNLCILNLEEEDAEKVKIMPLASCDQMTLFHLNLSNPYLCSTANGKVNYSKIPEEQFFGAL